MQASNRIGLRGKLLAGLALGLGLTVLASLTGLFVAWNRVGTEVPASVALDNRVKAIELDFRLQVQEWKNVLLRGYDPEQYEKYWSAFKKQEAAVQAGADEVLAQLTDDSAKQMLSEFAAAHREMGVGYSAAVTQFADAGFDPKAGDAAVKGMDRAPGQKLAELSSKTAELAVFDVAESSSRVRKTIEASIAITLLAVLATLIAMPIWITRRVVGPIRDAVTAAQQVSRGHLQFTRGHKSNDEVGELQSAMATMVSTLSAFRDAQQTLADRHDAGEIDYRIESSNFAGAYEEMAAKTNALVASHLAVQSRMAEVIAAYAEGDFSVDMDRLPGQKAALTEAMDGVKTKLTGINKEIRRLADAAAAGDYSVRGDLEAYRYDFRAMIEGLNTVMAVGDRNLAELSRVLNALAEGDLSQQMQGEVRGVFATIRDDVERTNQRLSTIVGGIKEATDAINTASREIAAGNSDLSARTEEQAASLEETASSMEELTSTVRQNAENARQANQLAVGASEVAVKGGEVVAQVVTTMDDINTSSGKIVDIISVIDGIAFQTNILALNAAVEAARAGEQGRGFAVVASEVRALAQRSAAAAKEIKQLIDDSVGKVADGAQLVDQAGRTMGEIVASVKRVTDIMAEISAASAEQSSGIEQVNQTITQMDEVTQQNAALVEEATAAARSLEEQAGELALAVSIFRTHGSAESDSAGPAKPTAPAIAPAPSVAPQRPAPAPRREPAPVARKAAERVPAAAAASDQHWQEF